MHYYILFLHWRGFFLFDLLVSTSLNVLKQNERAILRHPSNNSFFLDHSPIIFGFDILQRKSLIHTSKRLLVERYHESFEQQQLCSYKSNMCHKKGSYNYLFHACHSQGCHSHGPHSCQNTHHETRSLDNLIAIKGIKRVFVVGSNKILLYNAKSKFWRGLTFQFEQQDPLLLCLVQLEEDPLTLLTYVQMPPHQHPPMPW